jgi:hypothetical protein
MAGVDKDHIGQGLFHQIAQQGARVNPVQSVLLVLVFATPSLAAAQTMTFEAATTVLGASCGNDIDTNCRGVNLDSSRLKDCLARNQDSVSPQCKADYVRVFDAIQKRVAARAAIPKMCERDALKLCGGTQKQDGSILACILTMTRGLSAKCSQAISAAGYRQ